jgi:serine phosphatase RsbU (regulator of sigma subunit)
MAVENRRGVIILGRSYLFIPVFAALFLILSGPQSHAKTIQLDDSLSKIPVGRSMEYLVDEKGTLMIGDVQNKKLADRWKSSSVDNPGFGFTNDVYWVRFTIDNTAMKTIDFYLDQDYALIDDIKLYVPDGYQFNIVEVGRKKPFVERPYQYRTFIFPLQIKERSSATYYLRYQTSSSMNLVLIIWSPSSFKDMVMLENIMLVLFNGIILIMIVYNMLLFMVIRWIEYFFYSLFFIFYIIFMGTINGTAYQFLWPNHPGWAALSVPVTLCVLFIFITIFCIELVDMRKRRHNSLYRNILFKVSLVTLCINTLLLVLCFIIPYRYSMSISTIMAGVVLFVICIQGVLLIIFEKNRQAILGLIAASPIIIGTLAYVFKTLSILPTNFFTEWAVHIGILFMAVLFSIALADRVNMLRKELAALNLNLEDKVKDRTEKLEKSNKQLISARDALWGEMELAKKIQTVLLPIKPAIPGYELSVYMNPAAEVGGDYYDIINAGGLDWVVIGDVSGHGVPAGLIMMMVQTAINVTIARNPAIQPSDLLTTINKTITKNIGRISDDKYMTITVLAAHQDGRFRFSGLHQDILVFRAGSNAVECFNTDGMWIGLYDDIQGMMTDNTLSLEIGDTLLLYTDGITEAWKSGSVKDKRDPETEMFGNERLISILERMGGFPPDEIKNAIIKELREYTCHDDVTMVLLKRTS